jgi:DNA-binding NarL/FixJ family response regulator
MSESRRIRLVLVDDNPAVLRQVVQILPHEFEICDMLENGESLQPVVAACQPDIVVLDIALPGQSGIALASQLKKTGCQARIVFLTVHDDPDYVRSTFAAGATGYVVKMRLVLDLEPALRAAFEGREFISPLNE